MKNIAILILAAILIAVVYRQFAENPAPVTIAQEEVAEPTQPAVAPTAQSQASEPSAFEALISSAAEGAEVFIISPEDGAVVSSPVTVKFGIKNMQVTKAGDNQEFSGHHHLLINLEEMPDMAAPLPASEQIVHFGGGQTETSVELKPGMHSLRLLLGNYLHIPHDKPVISKEIAIIVK